MKEVHYKQDNAKYGSMTGVMRIIGRMVYFKNKNNEYTQQTLEQLKMRGAEIKISLAGWIQVDMFKANTFVKLGEKEFDVNETPEKEIEKILAEFYATNYTKAGFNVEVK